MSALEKAAQGVVEAWLAAMSSRDDDGYVEAELWEPWMQAHRALRAALDAPRESAPLDVERLARALNATVGARGWLRSTPPDPVAEWIENAAAIAAAYAEDAS